MNGSRRVALAVTAAITTLLGSSVPASAASGDVDASFASTGLMTEAHAGAHGEVSMVRGPEGRLIFAWSASTEVGVSGFFGNGATDSNFGSGGSSTITVPGATYAEADQIARDAQGRFVVVGWADFPSNERMVVARFTSEGDPDTAFSGDGLRTIAFARGEAYAYGVALRGGKIYLCGEVYTGSSIPADVAVVRLNGDGALDPGFGSGGKRVYKVPDGFAGDDYAYRIVPVADGRFVLAGAVGSAQGFNTMVMKIRGDGRVDRSFRGDGFLIMNLRKGGTDLADDLARDGAKLVVGVDPGAAFDPKIVRLRADGSRDTTFSGDGVGRYPFGSMGFGLSAIAVDASHRVYVVGHDSNLPLFRIRANGSLATGFGTGGLATNPATTAQGWDVMLQGNLVLVAGAVSTTSINATRYLT